MSADTLTLEPVPVAADLTLRSVIAVVNPLAGGVSTLGAEAVEAALRDALGERLTDILHLGDSMPDALEQAFAAAPDAVVVVGGDGTARAAATLARKTRIPVAPLPGGTLNIFPRRVYGERTLADAIACLETAAPGRVVCGRAGEEIFLVAAAVGGLVKLAALREAVRKGSFLRRGWSILRYLRARATSRRLRYRMLETGWREAHALVVALGTVEAAFGLKAAASESGDAPMEVAAVAFRDWGHLAAVLTGALTGGWRSMEGTDALPALAVDVQGPRQRPIPAMLDGELTTLPARVTLAFDPTGIPVLIPAP